MMKSRARRADWVRARRSRSGGLAKVAMPTRDAARRASRARYLALAGSVHGGWLPVVLAGKERE